MAMVHSKKLVLKNNIKDIEKLNETVEAFLKEGIIPEEDFFNINLALEEVFTNISSYGFKDGREHIIEINFIIDEKGIEITVTDDGSEFDPLAVPDPDLNTPAEEREIGGLGIYLVKKLMDDVSYEHENGLNKLSIIKKFK
ncbi:MAG: ATP-binding protein [Candidatus Kapaibacterium sp.]